MVWQMIKSTPNHNVGSHKVIGVMRPRDEAAYIRRLLLLLAVVLITPANAVAEQFSCHSIFDTTTLKVRADTRGWIDMEGKPRQEVETLIDSNGDRVWVYGPKQAFKIRPDGTGHVVTIFSDTHVQKSPAYYCKRRN